MNDLKITQTSIEGLVIIEPHIYEDERGSFMETYNKQALKRAGIDATFVQDNRSSSKKGVLRGLHYQKAFPQGKLVSVAKGAVIDVVVDIRKNSRTIGKWFKIELSAENRMQLYVPMGFAHGFLTIADDTEFVYKCTDYYHPEDECGILWNDKTLNIDWPIDEIGGESNLIISSKDKKWNDFKSIFKEANI